MCIEIQMQKLFWVPVLHDSLITGVEIQFNIEPSTNLLSQLSGTFIASCDTSCLGSLISWVPDPCISTSQQLFTVKTLSNKHFFLTKQEMKMFVPTPIVTCCYLINDRVREL